MQEVTNKTKYCIGLLTMSFMSLASMFPIINVPVVQIQYKSI